MSTPSPRRYGEQDSRPSVQSPRSDDVVCLSVLAPRLKTAGEREQCQPEEGDSARRGRDGEPPAAETIHRHALEDLLGRLLWGAHRCEECGCRSRIQPGYFLCQIVYRAVPEGCGSPFQCLFECGQIRCGVLVGFCDAEGLVVVGCGRGGGRNGHGSTLGRGSCAFIRDFHELVRGDAGSRCFHGCHGHGGRLASTKPVS